MPCVLHHLTATITAIYIGGSGESNKQKLNCVKVNGSKSFTAAKMDLLRQQDHAIPLPSIARVDEDVDVDVLEEHFRQNIPTKKQMVDPYRQGLIVEEGVGYRQTVVIRSYEVGPDKTATIESLLNLLQVIIHPVFGDSNVFEFEFEFETGAGNCAESCVDVGIAERWIWRHSWDDEEQSHMGCFKNASSN